MQSLNTIFGYNLTDKTACNRDRSVLNASQVGKGISGIWRSVDDVEAIKRFIKSFDTDKMETSNTVYFNDSVKEAWSDALRQCYGPRYCLSDSYDRITIERGYRVIKGSWSILWSLYNYLDIPYSKNILERREDLDMSDILDTLPLDIQLRYNEAMRVARRCVENEEKVWPDTVVVATCSLLEACYGMWDHENQKIYIDAKHLDRDTFKIVACLLHEYVHYLTGADDFSSRFEHAMGDILGKLAIDRFG